MEWQRSWRINLPAETCSVFSYIQVLGAYVCAPWGMIARQQDSANMLKHAIIPGAQNLVTLFEKQSSRNGSFSLEL